jgi:hypothetical protein
LNQSITWPPLKPPWSVEAIKARILTRLEELGKSLEDLPAGVRKGFEKGRWQNGPTISTLQTTADILELTVPELLGAPRMEKSAELDERRVTRAFKIAIALLAPADSDCPLRLQLDLAAEVASLAYLMGAKLARHRPDLVYSDDDAFEFEFVLESIRKARDLQKS